MFSAKLTEALFAFFERFRSDIPEPVSAHPRASSAWLSFARRWRIRRRYAAKKHASRQHQAESRENAGLVEAGQQHQRNGRAFCVPNSVRVAGDHMEPVLARRHVRVIRFSPRTRIDPFLIEAFQFVLEANVVVPKPGSERRIQNSSLPFPGGKSNFPQRIHSVGRLPGASRSILAVA